MKVMIFGLAIAILGFQGRTAQAGYALQDPVNLIDPSGLVEEDSGGGASRWPLGTGNFSQPCESCVWTGTNAPTGPTVQQLARGFRNIIGRNSVTIQTSEGYIRLDVAGRAHAGIPTPHLQFYRYFPSPFDPEIGSFNLMQTRPATMQDLRAFRNFLERTGCENY